MKIDPVLKDELEEYLKQKIAEEQKRVFIVAPYHLDESELNAIQGKFTLLQKAQIVQEEDKSLLGGFIIKFGSKMIDLSIKSELQKLKQSIYEIIW